MRRLGRATLLACAAAVVVGAFLAAVGTTLVGLDHNEGMYVAAGSLLAAGQKLYQDFAYLQAPNLALLYGVVAAAGFGDNLYFAAKWVTVGATFASGVFVFLLARWMTKDAWVAAMCTVLLLTSSGVLRAVSECSNYAAPIAVLFASYYLFCIARPARDANGGSSSAIVFAGVLASIAAGLKAYYALPALGILCATFFHHGGLDLRSRVRRVTVPFAAGLVLGALPVIYYATADFDAFVFNNYGYHAANLEWWQHRSRRTPMSLPSRIEYGVDLMSIGTNPLILWALVGVGLLALHGLIRQRSSPEGRGQDRCGWSTVLLLFTGCLAALSPAPSRPQYFAVPLSLAVVLVAAGAARAGPSSRLITRGFLALVVAGSLWVGRANMERNILVLGQPERWASERMAAKAQEIRSHLADHPEALKGASLTPLPLLLADVRIYNELSTGQFLFRVGDLLSAEERRRFVATSARSIGELFERDPPDLIYGGGRKSLDQPLLYYAERYGYREQRLRTGGRLLIRP
jgi:hypothetical protein